MDKKEIVENISYCGLICSLCHLADRCDGCRKTANMCANHSEKWGGCHHRNCCIKQHLEGCWECNDFPCDKDMYSNTHNIRIRAFARCIRDEGVDKLAGYIIENDKKGIKYGYQKDYDFKQNEYEVLDLLRSGRSDDRSIPFPDKSLQKLRADCENCFGFCCVALYFSASEGFPVDKDAGQPCLNLQPDFHCRVHKNLREQGLKGCIAFDCFGAGQKVAQVSFGGQDWREVPESAKQMFEVFLIMRQLHELIWYLTEALTLMPASSIHSALSSMLDETERLTHLNPDSLIELDVAVHRAEVNTLLLKTSELVRAEACRGQKALSRRHKKIGRGADLIAADLRRIDHRGANLRGAYLIAADLRGNDLCGTDFIGADLRDTDLRGADLSMSIFLTQAQLNSAKGDISTKLPLSLICPTHWDTF